MSDIHIKTDTHSDLTQKQSNFETYTKVFRSTGKSPHIPPEVLAKVPYDNINVDISLLAAFDSMQPNTTKEPFNWEKVSLAWANIFGRTADAEDVRHFSLVQQGGIGASCGVISLHYVKHWRPPQPKPGLFKDPTAKPRERGGNGRGGGDFGYGAFNTSADAGFGEPGGSSSSGGGFGDGAGGSSSGAGDGGNGGGRSCT
ncbi:hypothetical protein MBANPS3_002428 [Mucor bainieri]